MGPPHTDVYQPGPFEGKQSRRIGTVKLSVLPPAGSVKDVCSPEYTPDAVRLDLAVAELDGTVESSLFDAETIVRVNSIHPVRLVRKNDQVTFMGKSKGLTEARIGAYSLWDQINFSKDKDHEDYRCFGRIFELKPRTHAYVREELAYGGDSGSSVVFDSGDLQVWYGMVIAGDGGQAFACFAEYILEECNKSGSFPGGVRLSV